MKVAWISLLLAVSACGTVQVGAEPGDGPTNFMSIDRGAEYLSIPMLRDNSTSVDEAQVVSTEVTKDDRGHEFTLVHLQTQKVLYGDSPGDVITIKQYGGPHLQLQGGVQPLKTEATYVLFLAKETWADGAMGITGGAGAYLEEPDGTLVLLDDESAHLPQKLTLEEMQAELQGSSTQPTDGPSAASKTG